jgi:hypothetical protein
VLIAPARIGLVKSNHDFLWNQVIKYLYQFGEAPNATHRNTLCPLADGKTATAADRVLSQQQIPVLFYIGIGTLDIIIFRSKNPWI